ncbi:zinc finger protein OZF-like isoform X3 [Macrosteles quadrilineatus]|uniref:zinc finger protein OZF-like isoform X3 n=1 Tax=Macrosteles quadrilineatus TaxID=74068 RepID=UPI0023E17832|nr:zinc finger protein OZF-like isoform X3 [Macrosteles quadrilineatus]
MEVEEKFSDTDKIQFILVPKREPNDEECVKNVKSSWPPQEESTCNEDHREPITEKVKDENQHMSQDFNILVDDLLKDSANPNSDVKVKSEQDTEEPEENVQDLVESRVAEPNPSDYEMSTPQETVESGSDHGESHCPKRKRRNTTSKTLPVVAATSNEIQTLSSDSDSEEDEDTSAPIPGEVCTGIQDGILCQCERCQMCVKKIERSIDKDDTSKDSHKPLSCNICNLRFIYKSRLEKHLKVHKGLKLFPCDICNRAFAQKGGLKAHIERKHSTNKCKRVQTKKEICNICNKEISTHRLKNHIETVHFRKIESLLFRCKDCGKGFSHRKNLKVHTDAVHLREKQYKCAECHKVFKNKPILSYHIQTSHQQREEYICAICDRTYYTKNSLSLHINIHSGTTVVPVCCEICGKAVKNEYKLKTHMLVHNDDHKFSCQNCGKLFKRLHNLQQHEHTHRDNRPHVCNICGQTFKLRTHVKQHMAVHGIIKNHKCVVCEKTFARKTQLYTHMSTHGL